MKKLISIIWVILLAVFSSMSITALASDIMVERPIETVDTSWYHEDDDSFVIRTADELAGLAQLVNSGIDFFEKTILLENSIDLSDYAEDWNDGKGWTPIGHKDAPFRGTFNGNSKTITGLYINDSMLDYAGLFGYIDKGKVYYLGLTNAAIKGKDYVGGIVGGIGTSDWHPNRYPPADCGAVKNCFVTGVVEGTALVGGVVGTTSCTYTYYCYSAAEVTGKSEVGGIIGNAGLCGVENCYSTGLVSGDERVGGIAGNFSKGSLLNSYATGEVIGRDCVGGIVGRNYFDNLLRQCVALNESVRGTTNVGRIAGQNDDAQIRRNYALDSMAIIEGDSQKEALLNAHDQIDGEDIGKEDALQAAFWLETMEYKPSIFTIADGSYPVLSEIAKFDTDFYRVSFVDWDGTELKSILVPHGCAAKAPASPVRESYTFTGWNQAFDNVTGDLTVTATYRLANPFGDVAENDWFYDGVQYAFERGLMKGVSDDRFAPQDEVSRAMAATVLYRLAGEPEAKGSNPFPDVEEGQWYTDAVIWAADEKIIEGYGDGTFGTNDPVTREQLVTLLWRYHGRLAGEADALEAFGDAESISSWAKDAFVWAVDTGVIQGKTGAILDPKGTITRAEVAQVLKRQGTVLCLERNPDFYPMMIRESSIFSVFSECSFQRTRSVL